MGGMQFGSNIWALTGPRADIPTPEGGGFTPDSGKHVARVVKLDGTSEAAIGVWGDPANAKCWQDPS